jgi:DNA-binding NtrC family response regulator
MLPDPCASPYPWLGDASPPVKAVSTEKVLERGRMSSDPTVHIFVVDDEPTIASTLTAILRMNGFSARFFTNPMHALAASRLDRPHLLLSDVAMPGMSGIDLAVSMSEAFPLMKILLFSGQANTHDLLEQARTRGYRFHLLPKPIHPTALLSRIQELFDEKADNLLEVAG